MSLLSSGHVSVGGGSEGASQALQLRITASFLPGYVGGGDRRCWISGHRQDLGHLLPNLWTQVSVVSWRLGVNKWPVGTSKKRIQPCHHWPADLSDLIIFKMLTLFPLRFWQAHFSSKPWHSNAGGGEAHSAGEHRNRSRGRREETLNQDWLGQLLHFQFVLICSLTLVTV